MTSSRGKIGFRLPVPSSYDDLYEILEMVHVACPTPFPLFRDFIILLHELFHETSTLGPIVMGYFSDLLVREPLFASLGTILKHAQYPRFSCFPVNATIPFRMTRPCQCLVHRGREGPIGAPSGSSSFHITLSLHGRQEIQSLRLRSLTTGRGSRRVHLGMGEKMLKDDQFIHPQQVTATAFL
jgi:hypothetical protein